MVVTRVGEEVMEEVEVDKQINLLEAMPFAGGPRDMTMMLSVESIALTHLTCGGSCQSNKCYEDTVQGT